jgi:UDP-N-acetylglucosamine acyltransferase
MRKFVDIHPDAKIGENVEIGSFTTVYADVEIGDGTWIGPNVVIMDGARIGKNCRIFPGAVISAIPQDLKFRGEYTTTEIGDGSTIRECVTINRGTADRDKTRIGNNCLLMAYTHIAHDVLVGNNCIIANSASIAGHVIIGDHVVIEGVVAIQQFVEIGSHAFIAGGSLVRKNVPPYVKGAREPLSFIGVNTMGLKRRKFSEETIDQIQNIYREIYVQSGKLEDALKIVETGMPDTSEKQIILDFIRKSSNGIMRGI